MKTNDVQFDEALKKLARSLRTIEGTEGRAIARRHARQRVLKELRRVRALLDEKAPAIVSRVGVQRLKTFEGKEARLKRAGYAPCSSGSVALFAAAGVPVRRLAQSRNHAPTLYVPRWALAIGSDNPSKLRAAKKDPALRRSVVAAKMLQESAQ